MWYLAAAVAGLIVGIFLMGWICGDKVTDLQSQLQAKKVAWCQDCRTNIELKEERERVAQKERSTNALGGLVNKQLYEIERLKKDLRAERGINWSLSRQIYKLTGKTEDSLADFGSVQKAAAAILSKPLTLNQQ